MHKLLVMRHAKSSWDTGAVDHERPLNGRGRRQALAAGQVVAADHGPIDRTLCSTSKRTRETLQRLQDGGADAGTVTFHEEIYESTVDDVLPLITALPDDASTVLLIGHYPCVTELVVHLAARDGHPRWDLLLEKFVTSGIATLEFEAPWSELRARSGRLLDFVAPGRG